MNLLVTNTQEDQAYLIVRCLREHVDRIVVAVGDGGFLSRWGGMAPWSRFVSRRYRVPDCSVDWRAGRLSGTNSVSEEAYIQAMEDICRKESIDCVFPSYDSDVYVLSKNSERLAEQGVVTLCPEFDVLRRFLDKSLTLDAARKAGFPAPRSRVIENTGQLSAAAGELPPPWKLKPRCGAHAANILAAQSLETLTSAFERLQSVQDRPLLQEFIPPGTKRNFYCVVGRDHEAVSIFSPNVHRTRKTGLQTPCAAVESSTDIPLEQEVRTLLREMGAWGGFTVQTVVDERDGVPKLMEINPRLGHNLWYRTELGINEPLMLLRIAMNEDPDPVPAIQDGVIMLDPLWDLLHLIGLASDTLLRRLGRIFRPGSAAEDFGQRDTFTGLVREYRREYFGRSRRITSPLNRGFLSDPLPPLVRILRVFAEALYRRLK